VIEGGDEYLEVIELKREITITAEGSFVICLKDFFSSLRFGGRFWGPPSFLLSGFFAGGKVTSARC
jgi:hypothetical protein